MLGMKVSLGDSLGPTDTAPVGDALSQTGSQGIYKSTTDKKNQT